MVRQDFLKGLTLLTSRGSLSSMENEPSAAEALAIARESRRAALQQSRSPWWYFPASGVVLGAAVVAVLLAQGIGIGIAVILMSVSMAVLEFARRRVTGTRTSEFGRGRATVYAVIFGALGLATLAGSWFFVKEQNVSWVGWAAGAIIFVLVAVGGWVFERALLTSTIRR